MLRRLREQRNQPETDGTSAMSPYLHYGHVGPQTIALAVDAAAKADPKLQSARDSYFNELIAWRELAVNFVRYTTRHYDTADCAEDWAKKTIAEHARDERGPPLHARAARAGGDLRRALERRADPDGRARLDAQLHAHVLGQEDP